MITLILRYYELYLIKEIIVLPLDLLASLYLTRKEYKQRKYFF